MTQVELADKLGVAPRYIGNIEQGHRRPSLEMLIEICRYFRVELSDLLPLRIDRKPCQKERMVDEITAMCRLLEMTQIGLVKTMVHAISS
jgi:transcriptional regulator with XRE-family HTH domain